MRLVAALTGFRFSDGRWARFRWGEIAWRGWGLALTLSCYDDHWSLGIRPGFGSIYFRVWPCAGATLGDDISYGFSWHWGSDWGNGDAIHLNWGKHTKIIHMPWGWQWQRTSLLMEDGKSWVHELKGYNRRRVDQVPVGYPPTSDKWFFFNDLPHWQKTLPYRYLRNGGEVQERQATIAVHEMEWRMRWLQWLPWPRLVRRTVDVKFDAEIGERTGSWKGGVLGCGYDLRRDETPDECLKRMERERKFT